MRPVFVEQFPDDKLTRRLPHVESERRPQNIEQGTAECRRKRKHGGNGDRAIAAKSKARFCPVVMGHDLFEIRRFNCLGAQRRQRSNPGDFLVNSCCLSGHVVCLAVSQLDCHREHRRAPGRRLGIPFPASLMSSTFAQGLDLILCQTSAAPYNRRRLNRDCASSFQATTSC